MRIALALCMIFATSTAIAQEGFVELGELPDDVFETSGLLFFNDQIVTHNDSGGAPVLFEIDTVSRQITRTVTITNATNMDWEALTQDEDYIYIGDFGNNVGIRQDLTIYRIAKEDYLDNDTATAETIFFSYEDQTDFTDTGNSDWDAEAFFVLEKRIGHPYQAMEKFGYCSLYDTKESWNTYCIAEWCSTKYWTCDRRGLQCC